MMQKAQERYNRVKSFIKRQMLAAPLSVMGVDYDFEMLPNPVYLIEGDEDLRERADTLEAFGRALKVIGEAGYNVTNIQSEAQQYGVELEEKEVPEALDPSAPVDPDGQGDQIEEEEIEEGAPD